MNKENSIIVSGGSRGLGIQLVKRSLEKGYKVATFARSKTDAVKSVEKKWGDKFYFESVDALDVAQIKKYVNTVGKELGPIGGLINNAAIGQDHLLSHISDDEISRIININLTSMISLTRQVVKKMLVNGTKGRIIGISSICGMKGYAGLTVYSATKGGMDAFTRSLARELGPRGILVNAIGPGFFSSEMSAVLSPSQLEVIKRRTATEQLTSPEEMLPLLDSLMFENYNITGQVFYVDGGASI